MVNSYSVFKRHNKANKSDNRKFFRLPEIILHQDDRTRELSTERRRSWLARLGHDFTGKNLSNIRVCSDHFISVYRHLIFPEHLKTIYMSCTIRISPKTMPMQFREHFGKKCAVIIDCFEVFIDKPSNMLAWAETWSSYKHHTTVKFLKGITPQGVISYISNAWGGRTTDKHITEHSGFLDNIIPGDLVMADRGFDIAASVGTLCAQVKIPAFTKGKSQMSPLDLESTRKLANVRIHVERVIGLTRQKYTILNGPLPVEFLLKENGQDLPVIDKIGTVCCALVNLCDPVVAFD
ncbi:hypothetical protein MAR_037554 [Mya arenaria]|uniref:DDE Tnp4 domain-containing protein n=1 Tax=Mya arenaria TaxID=6604 RepID=A0ABY7FNT7_MYAAR|nr:hypothetical protein MAR_037554 [Mya arenaria]